MTLKQKGGELNMNLQIYGVKNLYLVAAAAVIAALALALNLTRPTAGNLLNASGTCMYHHTHPCSAVVDTNMYHHHLTNL